MKKLLSIALIVVLLFGFSFGEVTSLLELESFNVDCFTMLPWRGLQFNEGTSLYGEFSVYGDFDIGIFQYTSWSNVKDLNNDEIDLILSYKINLENLCFNILYTEYNLPAQNDWGHTREIGFSILMMDKFI